MVRTATYGSATIAYRLTLASRRSISISVLPDGVVTVIAPADVPLPQIDARVRKRARWILRQQRRFAEFRPRTPPRRYVGGETHRYMGRQYRLKIEHAAADRVTLRNGRLVVETKYPKDRNWIRTLLRRWMRDRAATVLHERFDAMTKIMKIARNEEPKLRVCAMKKRWGSHTPSGRILLNDRLVTARRECIDYVIAHELCHTVEPNHTKGFYRLLGRFMPDWERRKDLLERSTL